MRFPDFPTLEAWVRSARIYERAVTRRDVYRRFAAETRSPEAAYRERIELPWLDAGRPYYSVWPVVLPALLRLRLDADAATVRLPLPQLLLRFPEPGWRPSERTRTVRSVLAGTLATDRGPSLGLLADCGERHSVASLPPMAILSYLVFPLAPGATLERRMEELDVREECGENDWRELFGAIVRVVVGLSLIAAHPDLIEPDVLAADAGRAAATTDPTELERLVDRARRRGRYGWSVGARLTTDPHYRRPHLALRWTGVGRAVPRIVPVRGAIVQRRRLRQVPTGYLDPASEAAGA